MGVVCKDAWKNNYRGNSSSKPPVIYDSCYLPCAIAPVSLTRAASCYLPCAETPELLTGVAGYLRTDDSTDLVRERFVALYLSSFTKIKIFT